ncbi:N-6 DNA methylase [Burkholderia multivorans]|uniref:N-6 DNA methylase n=1 Tax=Burkholderia multivorans TaxID=87883 RepID=UPI0011B21B8C|nr:N-6 DNA methylase [Burkholderia multivorans]
MTISPNQARKSMKDIYKKIERLNRVSKQCQSPKQAIDHLFQLAFNLVSQQHFSAMKFPNCFVWSAEGLDRALDQYVDDLEAWDILVEATNDYIELVKASEPFSDLMGEGYGSHPLSKALGQFLTPPTVAEGGAKILTGRSDGRSFAELEEGTHITVADICSGAGTLLLQLLSEAYQAQPGRMNQVHAIAMDIDPNMVRMTSVQVALSALLHDIELGSLQVYWGNAITQYDQGDTRGFIYTPNQENYRSLLKQGNMANEKSFA